MENIVNRILEIDEKAVSIKEKTEEILENNEKELKKTLDELERNIMDAASRQAEKQYNSIINEASKKSEQIIADGDAEYNKLDNTFSQIKGDLEEKIFNKLFLNPT